ncbi:hypothetical protein BH20ACI2_BH20ACI2_25660 [soil metagenome]
MRTKDETRCALVTNTSPWTTNAQRSAWASQAIRPTATRGPLYGAMGFVRKSEKKSGLTHKKKP